jgi:hypothetical protein
MTTACLPYLTATLLIFLFLRLNPRRFWRAQQSRFSKVHQYDRVRSFDDDEEIAESVTFEKFSKYVIDFPAKGGPRFFKFFEQSHINFALSGVCGA